MPVALPLCLRAAQQGGELRRGYGGPLGQTPTRRTILRLERRDGFGPVCERIVAALPRMGPKLLLWGTPDPYFRGEHHRLEAAIGDLRRIMLPGAGHFAAEDASDEVARHLDEFLSA